MAGQRTIKARAADAAGAGPAALGDAAADPSPTVRKVVAARPDAPAELVRLLAADPSAQVRRVVAARPDAPVDVLRALAADRDVEARVAVADNPGTPDDVLAGLLSDRHWRVRLTAADKPSAAALTADDPTVRLVLAQQPNLPPELADALTRDESWNVRATLAQCTDRTDVVAVLLHDRDGRVRGSAGSNPLATLDQLRSLVDDPDWRARNAVVHANAGGRDVPEEDLWRLARDRSANVRYWLANLPGATRPIYELLSRDRDEMVATTAGKWLEPGGKQERPAKLGEPIPRVDAVPGRPR